MGGEWNATAKGWMVPDERANDAKALLAVRRTPTTATGGRFRSNVTRFSSGAVVYQSKRGRCEDAPCCGCCS